MEKYLTIEQLPSRVYLVGDIHGCLEEVVSLIEYLIDKEGFCEEDLLVFIGDYIDRGPDSKGVIEYLIGIKGKYPSTIFLNGNHEEMLLDYLGFEGSMGNAYLFNGGASCFKSYGFTYPYIAEEIVDNLPQTHLDFLLNLERYVITDEFVFAHAGVNPLRDIKWQFDEDLYWIREEFIANLHHFRKVIIFGHTPYQDLMLHLPYKIGIDTGLVYGNMLTCIELLNEQVYQVERDDTKVMISTFKEKEEKMR